jgi:truncated hemoglobin YjbI
MGVTVEFHGDLYTILVDQIGEVCLLDRADFEAAPATLDPKLKQLCTGIYRLDGQLLAVLDVNQILDGETIARTPPIQFFAKRPKEIKENKSAKALPAPANEDADEDPPQDELPDTDEVKVKTKTSKNPFRKKSPAAKDASDGTADSKTAEKPAQKAGVKPASASDTPRHATAKPAAAKPKAEPSGAVCGAEDAVMDENATDVAPGAPTLHKGSDDLLQLVGGESKLASCVAVFLERAAADDTLATHYDGTDLNAQGQAMQTFLVKALKAASEGTQVSAPGHKWLSPNKGIDDEAFNLCLNHLEKAMSGQMVPEGTVFRVLATVERYRESVVD